MNILTESGTIVHLPTTRAEPWTPLPAALSNSPDSGSGSNSGSPLGPGEEADLRACESVIRLHLQTFIDVGSALARIRDHRLYRAEYSTFEEYCQVRWSMSGRRARQHVEASVVVRVIEAAGLPILPATESQARPLVGLPAEVVPVVWFDAVASAPGGRVTAKHVTETVDAWRGAHSPGGRTPSGRPLMDTGERSLDLREMTRSLIEQTRELLDAIGTADSTAAADLNRALLGFDRFSDHLDRIESLQKARPS
jgi:hypothetical protein